MNAITKNPDYKYLLDSVSTLIEEARKKVVKQVNTIIIQTYWDFGMFIVEEEQKGEEKADYGTALIVELSKDLTKRYGKGFSKSNLFLMRKFYLTYPPQKFQTVSGKFKNGEILSWSKWSDLKLEGARRILEDLKDKSDFVIYKREGGAKNKKKGHAMDRMLQIKVTFPRITT
jgi:hypothetical protein